MIQRLMSFLELVGVSCPATPETWLDQTGCALVEGGAPAVFLFFLGILLAVTLIGALVQHLRRKDLGDSEAFLYSGTSPAVPRSARPMVAERVPHETASAREPASEPTPPPPLAEAPPPVQAPPPRRPAPIQEQRTTIQEPVASESSAAALSPGHDADASIPPEGTLQLLPGRLEIRNGDGAGPPKEIRFVRVPGTAPEVSFGRSDGPPHRHVQLSSPTVSRRHARMRFDGVRWTLLNESTTNPTRINGRVLDAAAGETALDDGDRIEMGEMTLVFRQEDIADRLPLRSSWYTDRGRRASNQDAVAVRTLRDGRELAVVCDGMGGHAAGAVASHTALEAFVKLLEEGGELNEAVIEANRAVREEAAKDPEREGMGTTLVALLREEDAYRIANVGDSRAYRIDAEGLKQITEDHSFVAEVVRDGRMSREEAERSPWRNAVTRHLGAEDDVEVDFFGPFEVDGDHLILLCSDGVHGILPDEALADLVRSTASVRDLAREAGEAALGHGGDDNVSVAVLQFGAGIPAAAHAEG